MVGQKITAPFDLVAYPWLVFPDTLHIFVIFNIVVLDSKDRTAGKDKWELDHSTGVTAKENTSGANHASYISDISYISALRGMAFLQGADLRNVWLWEWTSAGPSVHRVVWPEDPEGRLGCLACLTFQLG